MRCGVGRAVLVLLFVCCCGGSASGHVEGSSLMGKYLHLWSGCWARRRSFSHAKVGHSLSQEACPCVLQFTQ